MSGGVGPSDDILLPKEPTAETTRSVPVDSPRYRISFWHVNSLVVMGLLSVSGVVSLEDFAFVVFSLVYVYFLSRIAFPRVSGREDPPVFGKNNRILNIYVLFGGIIGMLLPIAYIFEGVYGGDKEGIKAAASHLFLLSAQVVMEGVSFNGGFSLPIRAFVPVFYNSRRIFTLVEWLRCEIYKPEMGDSGGARRLYFGRAIAVANMAFWCFNLFGFLLPVYLPKVFKLYHSPQKARD